MKCKLGISNTNKINILALIIVMTLIFSVTITQTAFADDVKEKKGDKKVTKKHVKKPAQKNITEMANLKTSQTLTKTSVDIESQLKACKTLPTQREQYECEKQIRTKQELDAFKQKATKHQVGPILFYYLGANVEKSGGKDIVNLRFLVENTGSKDNITLYCTGPAFCNYDVSDGKTTYKYSAHDFTNGQVVLKPGQSRFINMLFGPAIGYGSYIDFKFDPTKQYTFNIKEPWGSAEIPLNLK